MTIPRVLLFAAAILQISMAPGGANDTAPTIAARITLTDGQSRFVRIKGVGCSVSICSKSTIEAKDKNHSVVNIPLDSIAAIRNTTTEEASFLMKDGSQRRVFLLKDFRVLYVENPLGGATRLDLKKVRVVDFTAVSK